MIRHSPGFLLAVALLAGALAGVVNAEELPAQRRPPGQLDLEALDRLLASAAAELGAPGLAAAVAAGDEIVFARGYGWADRARNRQMSADIPVELGSVTKLLTGLALTEAAGAGRLDLEAPVSRWLPELPADPRGPITTHQLLAQTAGLLDREAEYGPADATPAVLLGEARELRRFPPGARFSYSNPGYALAGLVLERATGESYAAAMDRWLFDRIGLDKRPRFAPPQDAAIGYTYDAQGAESPALPPIDGRFTPAGYAWLSARELARVGAALVGRGKVGGRAALKEETVRRVTSPWTKVEGFPGSPGYGYGLFVEQRSGTTVVWHDGTMTGFTTLLRAFPERGVAIAVVINRTRPLAALARQLDAWLLGETAPPPAPLPPVGAQESAALVGRYEHRFPLEIVRTGTGCALRFAGRELPVGRLGEGRYAVELRAGEAPVPLVPWRDREGRVEGIQFLLWAFPRIPAAPAR